MKDEDNNKESKKKGFYFKDYTESDITVNNKDTKLVKVSLNRITFLFFIFLSLILIFGTKIIYLSLSPEKNFFSESVSKNFLKDACSKFPNKIALGLDAKDGFLSVSGWKENSNNLTVNFLKEVNDFGVSRLIYTDINKDGTKSSPNFEETEKIAEISNCPVVISGGVSSIDDVKKAKNLNNKNIEGIIIGKAIYDGDIQLDELAKEIDA